MMHRKKITLWLTLVLLVPTFQAQTPANLDINGVSAMIHPAGDLFWDLIGSNQFEVPKRLK